MDDGAGAYSWRIVRRTYARHSRQVQRWVLQRGYLRTLERWSPLSPTKLWRTTAERLYRTRTAAEKALVAAQASEAVGA